MKKMKQVTVKDCEKFIKELFAKYQGKGIETNCFFKRENKNNKLFPFSAI